MKVFCQKKVFTVIFGVVLLLSLFVLRTPKPTLSDNFSQFSAIRASEHIEVISRKPHSYYDQDELEEVREYLVSTLTNYFKAENVERIDYSLTEMKSVIDSSEHNKLLYPITNIFAKIPGDNEEGILLVAHYDSRGHVGRSGELGRSYGAMDDGYGVGALLELANLLKDENPKNTVYFLFTDAEEVGLYGAIMAAKDNRIMENIRFVINVESRGRYGPAYMFETSKNNHKVIDLYKKANFPVTYSMATAVYSVMPNFTDFTPFMETDTPGINFATLAGLDNYHSPLDSYENINQSSIEHIGVQVEPVVREFMNNEKYIKDNYFEASSDKVFFTIFAHTLISYSQITAIVLIVLVLLALISLFVLKIKKDELTKDIVTKDLKTGILLTIVLVVSGYIFSNVVAFIGKVPFKITYTRVSGSDIPTLLFMILIVCLLTKKINKGNKNNVLLIGTTLNAVLGLITTFFLPGASFLFTLTALVGVVVLVIEEFVNKNIYKQIGYPILYAFLMFIIIPLLYSFYHALTVGGVAILIVLLSINTSVLLPTIIKHYEIN